MTDHYRELIVAARSVRQGHDIGTNNRAPSDEMNIVKSAYHDTHPVYVGQNIDFNSWLAGLLYMANLVDSGMELGE